MSAIVCTLRAARATIAFGWAEPLTLDVDGRICPRDAEGARRFTVDDALVLHAPDIDVAMQAQEMLRALASPSYEWTLSEWLEKSGRQQREVLALFDRAILRAGAVKQGRHNAA